MFMNMNDIMSLQIGSALHLACCSKLSQQYSVVELLLRAGADVNLSHSFIEGGILKSPMVEYFRSRDIVDIRLVQLMLSYGGRIIMKSPISDARGQLRNLLKVHTTQPAVFEQMISVAESYDMLAIQRLPFVQRTRARLVHMCHNASSLQQLCRVRVRELMSPISPTKANTLPIPNHIRLQILGCQI